MKKRRTREHIIEDLGLNYIERQFLLASCSVQRIFRDYGYDANVFTYNENGEAENGMILLQLKSTDHLKVSEKRNAIEYSLSKKDLELWLFEKELMILVIYDARAEKAYYVVLQDYFEKNRLSLKNIRKFIRVFIPFENLLTPKSVEVIREIKNLNY